jgi:hypothetical protein
MQKARNAKESSDARQLLQSVLCKHLLADGFRQPVTSSVLALSQTYRSRILDYIKHLKQVRVMECAKVITLSLKSFKLSPRELY